MPEIRAVSSALIPAPPATVYGLIADYRRGHPSILPRQYFRELILEEGGYGAGTRFRFQMRSFGGVREGRVLVTEPEPGRRLVETMPDIGIETEFNVEPVVGTQGSRVTIATRYWRSGLRGWVERLLVPPFLRRVCVGELRLLAEEARSAPSGGVPA